MAQAWNDRIENRVAECNIKLKDPGTRVETLLHGDTTTTTEFHGIEFYHGGWRTIYKERDFRAALEGRGTRREISSNLGAILWFFRVSLEPLRKHPDFTSIYKVVTPEPGGSWDETIALSPSVTEMLQGHVGRVKSRDWRGIMDKWVPARVQFWATDASLQREVAVLMSGGINNPLPPEDHETPYWISKSAEPASSTNEGCTKTTIHLLELDSILLAAKRGVELDPSTDLFVIATDSMVARGWVTKGRGADTEGVRDRLNELFETLGSRRIVCIYVRTGDNVADTPTRPLAAGEALVDEGSKEGIIPARYEATVMLLRGVRAAIMKKVSLFEYKMKERRVRESTLYEY